MRCKARRSPAGLLQGCFCIESYRTLGRRKCYAKTRRTRRTRSGRAGIWRAGRPQTRRLGIWRPQGPSWRAGISPASPAAPAGRAPRALPPGRMRLFPLCHRRPGRCGDGSCCHPVIRGNAPPSPFHNKKRRPAGVASFCYDSSTANWLL